MTIYFVNPVDGDDTNDGLSSESPLRTVGHATSLLDAGDVLRLHAGSVYGPATVFPAALAGTPMAPILIEPYAGTEAVFDGRLRDPDLGGVPNDQWEPVSDGHTDEWRSRQILDERLPGSRNAARVRYGAFGHSRIRLITYARIEDLRATNESFHAVPLSDARDAGGPLVKDRTRKQPWTYLGPGLHWLFENPDDPDDRRGRVHVRLSRTHLHAAGTRDYTGTSDPNQVPLALTPEGRIALRVASSHVVLRNLVIANGGTTTLNVTRDARNVTFDHCTVYGGRFGVRVSGEAAGITFAHCIFDGGLAPWTVRSDVKAEYSFIDADGRTVSNGTGSETHDILVISHAADNVAFDHCTFRRAHDALQIGGSDASVHHCLFEDLNDEVVQFHAPSNAHVYKNLFRQVLHPFSFALEQGGGPIFIYRNVVDQRLPTRGYRTLPPDTPAAHIFRYGASYKTGHPMPAVHIYQNTFVAADRDDKASALSLLFARSDLSADAARVHLNNLVVGLDLDLPYTWAAAPSALRRSDGNLWHAPQREDAPVALFQRPDRSIERVRTLARLHELGWELASTFAEPKLVNFDDEIFQHGLYLGDELPHNDWRPAPGSPAVGAGVPLPDDLIDPDRPPAAARPDIGAMPAGGPPLRVGVDEAVVLPAPNTPIARAGPDQLVIDSDGDGFAPVTMNGTQSTTPTGSIVGYIWTSQGDAVATQPVATLTLPEGDHYLRLQVTNTAGLTDTDGLRIEITPPTPHGDNLVRNGGFEDDTVAWQVTSASIVSSPVHTGRRALRINPFGSARQRIPITPTVRYRVSAWARRADLPGRRRCGSASCSSTTATPVIATTDLAFAPSASYAFRQGSVVAPKAAVAMDLVLGGSGDARLRRRRASARRQPAGQRRIRDPSTKRP